MAQKGRYRMRTIFTSEDMLNIVRGIFNGGEYSDKATLIDANSGKQEAVDLATYLNVHFFSWKERIVNVDNFSGESMPYDEWVQSLNYSLEDSFGLVEIANEEPTVSQDIDGGTIRARITFLIQTNKIKNLEWYCAKIKNAFLGSPQKIENSFGESLTAYLQFGALIPDQEPSMTQLGETLVCTWGLALTYLKGGSPSTDYKISIGFGNQTYHEIVPIKTTWQVIMTNKVQPKASAPYNVGFINTSLSLAKTISFYSMDAAWFETYFWDAGSLNQAYKEVNIPIHVKVETQDKTYEYVDTIESMEKVISNGDFTVNSITLRNSGF